MRGLILIVAAGCASVAFAQGPPPGGGGGRGMPPATNLKVLTQDNYLGVMFSLQTAMGVRCDFCHNMADRASDEKPAKVVARRMMEMVKNVNATTFNGEQKVSCYTCHHGEQKPALPPPPAARGGGPPPPATPQ